MNSKKIYRSKNDKVIAGICGGLGEYSGINSNIIRIVFVISTYFTGGISIFVYIILADILPEEGSEGKKSTKGSYKSLFGVGGLLNTQTLKNEFYKTKSIELEGYQNRSGIAFDWRSKIMILLVILGVLFLLWKFGFIGSNFTI